MGKLLFDNCRRCQVKKKKKRIFLMAQIKVDFFHNIYCIRRREDLKKKALNIFSFFFGTTLIHIFEFKIILGQKLMSIELIFFFFCSLIIIKVFKNDLFFFLLFISVFLPIHVHPYISMYFACLRSPFFFLGDLDYM